MPTDDTGELLLRLRLDHGWSQLLLAERLCAASGVPTVTRHEISRWERRHRVPGAFWRRWLAEVLQVPPERLDPVAGGGRSGCRGVDAGSADAGGADEGGADEGGARLRRIAHAWLLGQPPSRAGGQPDVRRVARELTAVARRLATPGGGAASGDGDPAGPIDAPSPRRTTLPIAAMRGLAQLVGGLDLATTAGRWLAHLARETAAEVDTGPTVRLGRLADAGRIAARVAADGGAVPTALTALHCAVSAATGAGDRPLAGSVLAEAASLYADLGRYDSAALLARGALAATGRRVPGPHRALPLYTLALASARTGHATTAARALAAGDAAAGAGDCQTAVLRAKCLSALGRCSDAAPPLQAVLRGAVGPGEAAVAAAALADVWLRLREPDRAGEVAAAAVLDALRAGSVRAAVAVAGLGPGFERYAGAPIAGRYLRLAAEAVPYWPMPAAQRAGRTG